MFSRDDLIGTWHEIGAQFEHTNGTTTPAWSGLDARLMYSTDGYVSVVCTPAGRAPIEGAARFDLNEVALDDLPGLVQDVIFYSGRYDVVDDGVVHHVDICVVPNFVGAAMKRIVELDGDELSLLTEPDADGTVRRVRWRRLPAR